MGKLDGRCLCGAISYACDADPVLQANCHCTDCQTQSGAPFSTVVAVPADAITVTGDTLASFTTVGTDSRLEVQRQFCRECGASLFSIAEATPGLVLIKAGTLVDRSGVQPVMDIWTDSRHAWIGPDDRRLDLSRGPSPEQLSQLAGASA